MTLQSERIQLLMQRLSLTEMVHGYEALAEQAVCDSRWNASGMLQLSWGGAL
jgi:hypothetical protein